MANQTAGHKSKLVRPVYLVHRVSIGSALANLLLLPSPRLQSKLEREEQQKKRDNNDYGYNKRPTSFALSESSRRQNRIEAPKTMAAAFSRILSLGSELDLCSMKLIRSVPDGSNRAS